MTKLSDKQAELKREMNKLNRFVMIDGLPTLTKDNTQEFLQHLSYEMQIKGLQEGQKALEEFVKRLKEDISNSQWDWDNYDDKESYELRNHIDKLKEKFL